MSESEKSRKIEDFGSSDCYVAANRLLLGQYRVQVTGKDAELMAEDRYNVANALILMNSRINELNEYKAAIDRGGWDISPCQLCNELVVCIPDGLPMCESCGTSEAT